MNNQISVQDSAKMVEIDLGGQHPRLETYEGSSRVHEEKEEQLDATGFSAKWTNAINKIHKPIDALLQAITQVSAKNPKTTIASVICLSMFLLVVGLFTNFSVDVDEDTLWTPANSRPIMHSKWIENESGFPTESRNFLMFFHKNGGNVLGRKEVAQIFEVLDGVRGLDGYDEVCAEGDVFAAADDKKTCRISGVVRFWNAETSLFEEQIASDEDAIQAMSARHFPDGTQMAENSIFGLPQRDAQDQLASASSYSVVISFPETELAEEFESGALDFVLDMADAWEAEPGRSLLAIEVMAERSFADEFERAILNDIPLIPIVFVIMSIFTSVVFSKWHKVNSRSLLGFGAVAAVTLSLLSGFGLLFLVGIPFTSMTQILPFVIFGIGLDDVFIIMGSFSRQPSDKDILERISNTTADIGLSISLTTLTSSLAFGLGCMSSIPAVHWLCLYAFPTIMLVFLYQLTFFIACIVLDERRLSDRRRDCCIWITVQDDEEAALKGSNRKKNSQPANQETDDVKEEHIFDRFMCWYAEQLLRPWVKVAIVISFTALTTLCAISSSKLIQEFTFTDVMPDDSYVTEFFDAFQDYTARSSIAPYAYFRFVDQSKPDVQRQMMEFVDELVTIDAIPEEPEFFWVPAFQRYVNDTADLADATFEEQIDVFLSKSQFQDLYGDDIVIDQATGMVTASRCRIYMDNVNEEDVNAQIDALEAQRAVAAMQPINANRGNDWAFFSYDGIYNIWEFYSVSVDELILTTILGVVAVTGIALIFVPHWTAALFVLPLIMVLYVDLLGVMQWAGLHINAVSYISLVMSIGLLVDFVMHVLLRYYESAGNRREKTVEMLKTMGASILIGGISTFLGTLPLAFSSSTIFNTIFIAFVGLVTLGVGHGLILLPVILSTIGPEDQVKMHSSSSSSVTPSFAASNGEGWKMPAARIDTRVTDSITTNQPKREKDSAEF